MHFRFRALLWVCLIFPGAASADQVEPVATRIRIGGSGGPLGTMQLLAEAFKKSHPQATVVIDPSLGGGIKALRAGVIDLTVTSRPLKDAERSPDTRVIEYARTPFVFAAAVNTKRTVTG